MGRLSRISTARGRLPQHDSGTVPVHIDASGVRRQIGRHTASRPEQRVRLDNRLQRSCDELEKCVRSIERHKAASPRVAAMCRRNCVLFSSGD